MFELPSARCRTWMMLGAWLQHVDAAAILDSIHFYKCGKVGKLYKLGNWNVWSDDLKQCVMTVLTGSID